MHVLPENLALPGPGRRDEPVVSEELAGNGKGGPASGRLPCPGSGDTGAGILTEEGSPGRQVVPRGTVLGASVSAPHPTHHPGSTLLVFVSFASVCFLLQRPPQLCPKEI